MVPRATRRSTFVRYSSGEAAVKNPRSSRRRRVRKLHHREAVDRRRGSGSPGGRGCARPRGACSSSPARSAPRCGAACRLPTIGTRSSSSITSSGTYELNARFGTRRAPRLAEASPGQSGAASPANRDTSRPRRRTRATGCPSGAAQRAEVPARTSPPARPARARALANPSVTAPSAMSRAECEPTVATTGGRRVPLDNGPNLRPGERHGPGGTVRGA